MAWHAQQRQLRGRVAFLNRLGRQGDVVYVFLIFTADNVISMRFWCETSRATLYLCIRFCLNPRHCTAAARTCNGFGGSGVNLLMRGRGRGRGRR